MHAVLVPASIEITPSQQIPDTCHEQSVEAIRQDIAENTQKARVDSRSVSVINIHLIVKVHRRLALSHPPKTFARCSVLPVKINPPSMATDDG
jgi:hypothetical protein